MWIEKKNSVAEGKAAAQLIRASEESALLTGVLHKPHGCYWQSTSCLQHTCPVWWHFRLCHLPTLRHTSKISAQSTEELGYPSVGPRGWIHRGNPTHAKPPCFTETSHNLPHFSALGVCGRDGKSLELHGVGHFCIPYSISQDIWDLFLQVVQSFITYCSKDELSFPGKI